MPWYDNVLLLNLLDHVCGMEDAHSSEFNPETNHPVIALMSSQINVEDKGGTMRLGSYPCKVTPGTKTYEAYGSELIHERHRHRFEFNNEFKQELTDAGSCNCWCLPR